MTTKSKQANPTQDSKLDRILDQSPIDEEVPDDIWDTIHATWTGLWTDGYGQWDEKQPSDIYPLTDLLSTEAEERLKAALLAWRDQEVVKERATLESDIAYAIGYARSLGKPCEYLEKRYPNLTTKEEQINE